MGIASSGIFSVNHVSVANIMSDLYLPTWIVSSFILLKMDLAFNSITLGSAFVETDFLFDISTRIRF